MIPYLLILSSALAQFHPCKAPPQWSAGVSLHDQAQKRFGNGKTQYDAINKREVSVIQETVAGVQQDRWGQLSLWNANGTKLTQYQIDFTTKDCQVKVMNRHFHPFGVPPYANYSGEAFIGGPGEQIDIIAWNQVYKDDVGNLISYSQETVTVKKCWPVSWMYAEPLASGDGLDVRTYQWYNVVVGLVNPWAFTPPAFCPKPPSTADTYTVAGGDVAGGKVTVEVESFPNGAAALAVQSEQ
eukprot:g19959.t1